MEIGTVKNRNQSEKFGFGLTYLITENRKYQNKKFRLFFYLVLVLPFKKPKMIFLYIPKIPKYLTEYLYIYLAFNLSVHSFLCFNFDHSLLVLNHVFDFWFMDWLCAWWVFKFLLDFFCWFYSWVISFYLSLWFD